MIWGCLFGRSVAIQRANGQQTVVLPPNRTPGTDCFQRELEKLAKVGSHCPDSWKSVFYQVNRTIHVFRMRAWWVKRWRFQHSHSALEQLSGKITVASVYVGGSQERQAKRH